MAGDTFLDGMAARIGAMTPAPLANGVNGRPGPTGPARAKADEPGAEYMRLHEASRLACVSIPTLKSWAGRGLKILRPSPGVVLVKRSDLVRFIEEGGK